MARIPLLERSALEEGTYTIKFTFKDEDKTIIDNTNIVSLRWWLTDLSGSVINSRSEVNVTSIINPWYLTVYGDDLQMGTIKEDYDFRLVTLRGTYNSSRGLGLPFTYSVMFKLKNLLIIAQDLNISTVDMIFIGEAVVSV